MDDTGRPGLRLPQLPKLDQRDIDAVRSFLPSKLLGRTAALLSLVLLVLGFAGAVDRMLEQWLDVHYDPCPGCVADCWLDYRFSPSSLRWCLSGAPRDNAGGRKVSQ
jgi:hypothetical protein